VIAIAARRNISRSSLATVLVELERLLAWE